MSELNQIVLQVALTTVIAPLVAYLVFIRQADRTKSHRFDEIRHAAYVEFTHRIIDVALDIDAKKARSSLRHAWFVYEDILLSSDRRVIAECWRLRAVVELYIHRLEQASSDKPRDLTFWETTDEHRQKIFRNLTDFHVVARKELGLGDVSSEDIYEELQNYQERLGNVNIWKNWDGGERRLTVSDKH